MQVDGLVVGEGTVGPEHIDYNGHMNVVHYRAAFDAAMAVTIAAGGAISHHHGIGRAKVRHFQQERGAAGVALLRGLKKGCDPDGICNPGVLGL